MVKARRKNQYAKLFTSFLYGIESFLCEIEVSITTGLPSFDIVGLADSSIKESKDRVRSAIWSSGWDFPLGRITICLLPAYVHKSGSSFDLPVALGILMASRQISPPIDPPIFCFGELTLNGCIREVPGSVARLITLQTNPNFQILIPKGHQAEAKLLGLKYSWGTTLKMLVAKLEQDNSLPEKNWALPEVETTIPDSLIQGDIPPSAHGSFIDFSLLKGQAKASRGIILAAAGFHNILLEGSPGSGKTTAAKIIQGLLPPLTIEEKLNVLKIHSTIQLLTLQDLKTNHRPFRQVHHTCSKAALIGGGLHPLPGEISLANHGILLLDELAEFNPNVIDLLRQPLEDKKIRLARHGRSVEFPANFLLVGTMNPCRCGHLLEKNQACTCSMYQQQTYRNRISGPLLDRIDLFIQMYPIDEKALFEASQAHDSKESLQWKQRIKECWDFQFQRCEDLSLPPQLNGVNQHTNWLEIFRIPQEVSQLAIQAANNLHLSARGLNKLFKTARTIGDLEQIKDLHNRHILEAIQFRSPFK